MQTILIANPKGGCGKTTIAINLAGYFARQGRRVLLSDLDRQQSALRWLSRRPARLPTIHPHGGTQKQAFDTGSRAEIAILDAPAGQHGRRLKALLKHVDQILIPVQASAFDMGAGDDFLALLAEFKRVRKGKCGIATVGNRVHARTLSATLLDEFVAGLDLPVLGMIRDAQIYVQMAADGTTLFDLPAYRAARDVEQWQGILAWVNGRT